MRQRSSLVALRRLQTLIVTVGLVLAGVVGLAPQAQAADGNILPPFDQGQNWNICQGYNNAAVTHTGTSSYGLDLTGAGCDNSASGRTVRAPMSGTVYYYQASYGNLCVNVAGGRSYTLTHISSSITGGSVTAGQAVGTVGAPGTHGNNGVAHIHFQMWDTANCYSSSGIPFDSAHGTRICGAPDLTASGPNNGNGTWSGTSFTGQSCGSSSGTGSFSGDGNADVLWYESWNNGGTAKMIKTNSSGSGTDSSNVWFSGYAKPTWAGSGDFNGDGKTDLAWYESWNNGTMKVLLSNGSGFGSSVTWFSGYAAPTKAFIGDFTGDGKDDIGWYESWNNGGTLKVIKTASSGTSNGGTYTWFSGYANPDWADAGDLNGDGKDDIAWFEGWNNGSLKVIYSSGSGTSSTATWFSGYAKPTWAAIGNFTGGPDKKEDIAWYESWNNGTLKVIPSNGNASGTPITWFSGYAAPSLAFAADFNGDKRDDIAWYEVSNNGTMKVIPTNSAGTGGATSYAWFSGYAKPDWASAG